MGNALHWWVERISLFTMDMFCVVGLHREYEGLCSHCTAKNVKGAWVRRRHDSIPVRRTRHNS